ncbi:MAG TPA: hypothetical protein PLO61_09395 [Fimbriimonadaceae bacterium]|nr:hypothetical protein [Fimbriimonadaceae bacterium]HRJ33844.1 hypothetical protein [Fimbriimonadaceae bacterium]
MPAEKIEAQSCLPSAVLGVTILVAIGIGIWIGGWTGFVVGLTMFFIPGAVLYFNAHRLERRRIRKRRADLDQKNRNL